MNGILFTFRSITTAQRAQFVCRSKGVDSSLRRTPRRLEQQGCGYCLVVANQHGEKCARLFRENDIAFRRVYRLIGDYTEEIRL